MHVLIIEDDSQIRNNMAEMLELEDHTVETASNGQEGLAKALASQPNLIFCDVMMPKMNGYEVLEELRKHPETASIPLIFITARTEREAIQKGLELGATDYLLKPFTSSKILSIVNSFNS